MFVFIVLESLKCWCQSIFMNTSAITTVFCIVCVYADDIYYVLPDAWFSIQ